MCRALAGQIVWSVRGESQHTGAMLRAMLAARCLLSCAASSSRHSLPPNVLLQVLASSPVLALLAPWFRTAGDRSVHSLVPDNCRCSRLYPRAQTSGLPVWHVAALQALQPKAARTQGPATHRQQPSLLHSLAARLRRRCDSCVCAVRRRAICCGLDCLFCRWQTQPSLDQMKRQHRAGQRARLAPPRAMCTACLQQRS